VLQVGVAEGFLRGQERLVITNGGIGGIAEDEADVACIINEAKSHGGGFAAGIAGVAEIAVGGRGERIISAGESRCERGEDQGERGSGGAGENSSIMHREEDTPELARRQR